MSQNLVLASIYLSLGIVSGMYTSAFLSGKEGFIQALAKHVLIVLLVSLELTQIKMLLFWMILNNA